MKDKIKNQTNNRANNKADEGIDKSLDKVEEGIGSLFKKDKTDGTQPQEQAKPVEEQTQIVPQNQVNSAGTPSLQSYSKFDFIPGEKVIFYEDFSQDAIGDFPPRLLLHLNANLSLPKY
ncbi:MAG: hypothetical protein Q7U86_00755 [Draconibacterium sp.]|nr:hypothetical protein [Draconibacterium sp.]